MPPLALVVAVLVVVIPLEAAIFRKLLPLGFARALGLSLLANLPSTILGAMIWVALEAAPAGSLSLRIGTAGWAAAVAVLYVVTALLEFVVAKARLVEIRRPKVLRAVLGANAVSCVLLFGSAWFVVAVHDSNALRKRVYEVLKAGSLAKVEAWEYFQANGRFRATRQEKPNRHTRLVTTSDSGRVTAEVDYPSADDLHGKTVAWEPEIRNGKIVDWHCYVPEAPLKYFPAPCRFRTAADARGTR